MVELRLPHDAGHQWPLSLSLSALVSMEAKRSHGRDCVQQVHAKTNMSMNQSLT